MRRRIGPVQVGVRLSDRRVVEEAVAEHRDEDVADDRVEARHRDLAGLDCVAQRAAVVVRRRGVHLEIEAGVGRRRGRVRRAPVARHEPVEAPLVAQHAVEQLLVLAHVLAEGDVVRAHQGADVPLLDGGLERREVDLVQRAVVNVDVDRVAVELLIVEDVMLRLREHRVALDASDRGGHHLAAQVRILAPVLEVPAIGRDARHVHTWAEHHVDALRVSLLAERLAEAPRHRRIPHRSLGDAAREDGRPLLQPDHARARVAHVDLRDAELRDRVDVPGRAVVREPLRLAEGGHVELLVEAHGLDEQVGTLLRRLVSVHPWTARRCRPGGRAGNGGGGAGGGDQCTTEKARHI